MDSEELIEDPERVREIAEDIMEKKRKELGAEA